MQQSVIYPPNRPFERIMKPSDEPVLYENLIYIDANTKGEIILGCSNISGTYWEGVLFYYKSIQAAQENSYSGYFISDSTTSDGKFLKDINMVLVAEDVGSLKLFSMPNDNGQQKLILRDCFEKTNRMEQIAVWDNSVKAVTCSDNSVSVYDIYNGASITLNKKYENFHTDTVTSVDVNNLEQNLFVSTSVDRRACIWDERMDIPASLLYANEFCSLTSAAWKSLRNENVIVGSEAGDIYFLDIRQPKNFVSVTHCFDDRIHRIVFNSSGDVAICGDLPTVLVYKNEKLYESDKHSGIVRGLTWFKNKLYSCGFDKKIISHVF